MTDIREKTIKLIDIIRDAVALLELTDDAGEVGTDTWHLIREANEELLDAPYLLEDLEEWLRASINTYEQSERHTTPLHELSRALGRVLDVERRS